MVKYGCKVEGENCQEICNLESNRCPNRCPPTVRKISTLRICNECTGDRNAVDPTRLAIDEWLLDEGLRDEDPDVQNYAKKRKSAKSPAMRQAMCNNVQFGRFNRKMMRKVTNDQKPEFHERPEKGR